jgi:hypothetical protein
MVAAKQAEKSNVHNPPSSEKEKTATWNATILAGQYQYVPINLKVFGFSLRFLASCRLLKQPLD